MPTYSLRMTVLWRTFMLLLLPLVVLLSGAAGVLVAPPPTYAAAAYIGEYSPNTRIEMRGDTIWFVRPPYESRMLPTTDGVYIFEAGWLAGRAAKFVNNESGGVSILLRADDGNWNEFARSGEIYTDLDPSLRAALAHTVEDQIRLLGLPGAVLYVHIDGQGEYIVARGVAGSGAGHSRCATGSLAGGECFENVSGSHCPAPVRSRHPASR